MATLVLVASPFPGKLGVARHSIRGNCSRVSWKSTRITEGSSTPPWLAGRCFRTWLPKIEGPTVGGGQQRVATSSPQPRGMVCDTIFAVIHYFLYSMRDYIVIYKGSTRYIARVCRQFLFEIFFPFSFGEGKRRLLLGADPTAARFAFVFPPGPSSFRPKRFVLLGGMPIWRWRNGSLSGAILLFGAAFGSLETFFFFFLPHPHHSSSCCFSFRGETWNFSPFFLCLPYTSLETLYTESLYVCVFGW